MNGDNLPYQDLDVVPFTPITSEWGDGIGDDILALAAGTGLDNGSITGQKIDFASTGTGAIWYEELGRSTLMSNANSITVNITAKKYLKIIIYAIAAGGTVNYSLRFNGDTGNNYAARSSANGGADGTGTSLAFAPIAASVSSAPKFTIADVINVANQEKLISFRTSEAGTAGAGNAPDRAEGTDKWSNTTSQITSVTLFQQGGTGGLATGSQILVLGHD